MKNSNERVTYFNKYKKLKTAMTGLHISITSKNEKQQRGVKYFNKNEKWKTAMRALDISRQTKNENQQ